MTETQQFLADYVKNGSEPAFRELVTRYVDLVYSAAVRLLNNDTHLAEDVTQTVFADLARMARTLSPEVMLGGWLHRHTCFVASKTMRGERRRQNRERQAVEMNSIDDHSDANLGEVAPILDEAIDQLGTDDRQAILLRFFEQRDFRSVGEALGSNEDAARKRVNRALEKLHSLLTRRGVALSATALGTMLSTQAVTAAPMGLAVGVSSAALATAAATSTTAVTFLQIMNLKLKLAIISAVAVAVAIPLVVQQQQKNKLREENAALRQQAEQAGKLAAENERLANLATEAKAKAATPATNDSSREVVKLRGEVGKLRTALETPKPSTLSGIQADPEMRKMIRDQQKMGLGMAYKDFIKQEKLPKELEEKLGDILADNVMENIDHITEVLRDGKTSEEMEPIFAAQDLSLDQKVEELLGKEKFSQYKDYTRNLVSYLSAQQFKEMMSGEKAEKDKKVKQLDQLLREETQQTLAAAGLSLDFQTVPMLNFRNIASEQEAEKNLKLLEGIYERAGSRASSFLTAEEIKKLEEFKAKAVSNNRAALTMNRKMMAPAGK